MTTEEKRLAIARVYSTSDSWQAKVADMSESQVIAIYLSFEKNGTFRRTFDKNEKTFRKRAGWERKGVKQLSIFDILKKE